MECSPGTFVYWDRNYANSCPEQPFLITALATTRVVSVISTSRLCVDLGHKSIASENSLHHRVFFLNAPELKVISHCEEHLVLKAGKDHGYQPGDILFGLPFHVCLTVVLYESAVTVEHYKVTGEWKTVAGDRNSLVDRLLFK